MYDHATPRIRRRTNAVLGLAVFAFVIAAIAWGSVWAGRSANETSLAEDSAVSAGPPDGREQAAPGGMAPDSDEEAVASNASQASITECNALADEVRTRPGEVAKDGLIGGAIGAGFHFGLGLTTASGLLGLAIKGSRSERSISSTRS
jgi:hypothetical protein